MKVLFSMDTFVELITNIAPPEPSIAVLFKKVGPVMLLEEVFQYRAPPRPVS